MKVTENGAFPVSSHPQIRVVYNQPAAIIELESSDLKTSSVPLGDVADIILRNSTIETDAAALHLFGQKY